MNYRHHYHAGNYADVFKHVLLLQLLRAMQRKEKGFLYLDTHAGRGRYALEARQVLPDGRSREAEWPAGIGRLWDAADLTPAEADLVGAVRALNVHGSAGAPETYPGSPRLAANRLRPQDRAALCELRPDDAEALAAEFSLTPRVTVQATNGYQALRALLPPPEKRALVLVDPPFESASEFADILAGLREALRRFPSGVYAIWYPITDRTRSDRFQEDLVMLPAPPALAAELQVAADGAQVRMKGCGLVILNPPWQIEGEIRAVLPALAGRLAQAGGGSWSLRWLVPER